MLKCCKSIDTEQKKTSKGSRRDLSYGLPMFVANSQGIEISWAENGVVGICPGWKKRSDLWGWATWASWAREGGVAS